MYRIDGAGAGRGDNVLPVKLGIITPKIAELRNAQEDDIGGYLPEFVLTKCGAALDQCGPIRVLDDNGKPATEAPCRNRLA